MIPPLLPKNEDERINALRRTGVLDTDPERNYDDLTFVASLICGTPIALISLVDSGRQWFKSRVGLEVSQTSRDSSFCAHAIHDSKIMVVHDTLEDPRFVDNPLVTGDPGIRFYAGAPLTSTEGFAFGTICVIDRVPRDLTEPQHRALEALSRQVSSLLELRQSLGDLREALRTIKLLSGLLPICAWCKKIRNDRQEWLSLETYIESHSEANFTHGICPECSKRVHPRKR